MVRGCGCPHGYPRTMAIYLDIHTDIRADVRVESSVLRTVRPGVPKVSSLPTQCAFLMCYIFPFFILFLFLSFLFFYPFLFFYFFILMKETLVK